MHLDMVNDFAISLVETKLLQIFSWQLQSIVLKQLPLCWTVITVIFALGAHSKISQNFERKSLNELHGCYDIFCHSCRLHKASLLLANCHVDKQNAKQIPAVSFSISSAWLSFFDSDQVFIALCSIEMTHSIIISAWLQSLRLCPIRLKNCNQANCKACARAAP